MSEPTECAHGVEGGNAGNCRGCELAERGDLGVRLDEADRQLVLLALAVLSLESPGFDDALNRIAVRIDNVQGGRAELYDTFRRLRSHVARQQELLERLERLDATLAPAPWEADIDDGRYWTGKFQTGGRPSTAGVLGSTSATDRGSMIEGEALAELRSSVPALIAVLRR